MSLLTRLQQIEELPTLPEILINVRKIVYSDLGDAHQLAKVILQDPSLSSKILKIANSSFYHSSSNRISSIPLAVARLGFDEVYKITLAMNVVKHFDQKTSMLGYKGFWKHSLVAGYLTSHIAEFSKINFSKDEREDLFLSALLHDIGILILDQFFHEEFDAITSYAITNEVSYIEAEYAVMAKESHGKVGGALLELWNLRAPIVTAVRFHHKPEKSPEHFRKFASIINIVEFILCNGRIGSFEGTLNPVSDETWEFLGIPQEYIGDFFEIADNEAIHVDSILNPNDDYTYATLKPI